MTIYKALFSIAAIVTATFTGSAQCRYIQGNTSFEIRETVDSYEVLCAVSGEAGTSRNRNIMDKRLRMTAVDLIGAYILYKETTKVPEELFQIYVDGVGLHYNANLDGLFQSERNLNGKNVIIYSCDKDKYSIENASYNKEIDIPVLLREYYRHHREEKTVSTVCRSGLCPDKLLQEMEHDFMTGNAAVPSGVRQLYGIADRLELSILSIDAPDLELALKTAELSAPASAPYSLYYYREMVTSMPVSKKNKFYQKWQKELSGSSFVWDNFRLFCSSLHNFSGPGTDVGLSEVVEAYGVALNPSGMRRPIDDNSYRKAAAAYSESDFEESARILTEAIDCEGISASSLNLLGASLRCLGKPETALPYLLLCFSIDPHAQYLGGNIALCAKAIGYKRLPELCSFLANWSADSWSKNEIMNCITEN